MLNAPPDLDGLTLPDGLPQEAAGAVLALQRASMACSAAAQALEGTPTLPAFWSGDAAQTYRERRAELARRCGDLEAVSASAAGVLQRWSAAACDDRAAMVRARDQVDLVRQQEAAARSLGQFYTPELSAAADSALAAWSAGKQGYWDGVQTLARQLRALRDGITDRPLGVGEQAASFVSTIWDGAVAQPASLAWSLTGQAVTDRAGWWRDVRAVPGRAWDAAAAAVTDPVGYLAAAVDAPAWQQGHVGEGAGAVAAMLVPGPKWLRLGPAEGLARYGGRVGRRLPKPTLQTVDELLTAPDLDRHEHPDYGHTLARHVNVDDEYLMDRLTYGTLAADGTRDFAPGDASRFTDQATAEAAIGETLRAHEAAVRAFAASAEDKLQLTAGFARDIGVVFRPSGALFERVEGNSILIRLKKTTEGDVYIETAFVRSSP